MDVVRFLYLIIIIFIVFLKIFLLIDLILFLIKKNLTLKILLFDNFLMKIYLTLKFKKTHNWFLTIGKKFIKNI